jgi:hypothetical protein
MEPAGHAICAGFYRRPRKLLTDVSGTNDNIQMVNARDFGQDGDASVILLCGGDGWKELEQVPMFGWLKTACPVDLREKVWTELAMGTLADRWGWQSLRHSPVILPTASSSNCPLAACRRILSG